jgi:hypothetical protein
VTTSTLFNLALSMGRSSFPHTPSPNDLIEASEQPSIPKDTLFVREMGDPRLTASTRLSSSEGFSIGLGINVIWAASFNVEVGRKGNPGLQLSDSGLSERSLPLRLAMSLATASFLMVESFLYTGPDSLWTGRSTWVVTARARCTLAFVGVLFASRRSGQVESGLISLGMKDTGVGERSRLGREV